MKKHTPNRNENRWKKTTKNKNKKQLDHGFELNWGKDWKGERVNVAYAWRFNFCVGKATLAKWRELSSDNTRWPYPWKQVWMSQHKTQKHTLSLSCCIFLFRCSYVDTFFYFEIFWQIIIVNNIIFKKDRSEDKKYKIK